MYEGERVRLRGFRPEETEICAGWLNDLATMYLAGGGGQTPRTVGESQAWLNRPGQNRFAVETLTGRLIGMCVAKEFDEKSRHCMVGWLIGEKDARGKGYGSDMIRALLRYAFEERGMERVALDTIGYNAGAIRLYERMGFAREGVLREHAYAKGRYWDVHFFSMLRREYDARFARQAKPCDRADRMADSADASGSMALEKGFVYLDEAAPGIRWDAKYATSDNLTGAPLDGYRVNRVVGTAELGAALQKAADYFECLGFGLLIYDAYRPARAVRTFARWAARAEDFRTKARHYPNIDKEDLFRLGYIAEKSGHSRGSSVDLTLTRDGAPVDMGGIFDLMDEISHHTHPMPTEIAGNRHALREGMEACGFRAYDAEWWHYNLASEPYPDTYFDFEIV